MLKHKIVSILLFLFILSIYIFTMVPSITQDDSGELCSAGTVLGTAHSPGYPLYILTSKIIVEIIPFGNFAYRVNLVSAIFIALTGLILFFIVFDIVQNTFIAAILNLLFCFSAQVWGMANSTEVYGIAAFVTVLILFVIIKSIKTDQSVKFFYLFSFLFGIGLNAHYTIALIFLGVLWWLFYNKKILLGINPLKHFLAAFLFFVIGFSIVLFLYVRAKTNPLAAWEDPKTLGRLWQVIARLRYGTISLTQGSAPLFSFNIILNKLIFFFSVVKDNFTFPGLILFFVGLFYCFKDKNKGRIIILFLIGTGPIFLILANTGLTPSSMDLLKRFFFFSFIFVVIIISYGIKHIPVNISIFSALIPCFLLFNNYKVLNYRNEYIYYDYARDILKTVPQGALLFSDRADEMEFSLGYFLFAEKRRHDIKFVDCNAGITRSIYGDNYYRIWGKPRLDIRERIEKNIIEKVNRPVYYATFDPDMIPIRRFQEGLIYRARPANSNLLSFPYDEIYIFRIPDKNILCEVRKKSLLLSYYQLLGNYFLNIDKPEKADKIFMMPLVYNIKNSWFANTGFAFHQKGYVNYAEKYYKMAAASGDAGSEIYSNLGVIYKMQGFFDKAEKYYLKAIDKKPDNAQAHYNLGVLYWAQHNWGKAADEFAKVLDIDNRHADAKKFLKMAIQKLNYRVYYYLKEK